MGDHVSKQDLLVFMENVSRLLTEYQALKQKYEYLALEYHTLREKLPNVDLDADLKNNVEPVIASSSELVLLKSRIDEYIREIDDCIAILAMQD